MTKFQQNITQYIKKIKNMANSQEKIDRNQYKEGQKIHLLQKDFRSTVLNLLKVLTQTMDKEVRETRSTMHKQQKTQKQ